MTLSVTDQKNAAAVLTTLSETATREKLTVALTQTTMMVYAGACSFGTFMSEGRPKKRR